MSRPGTTEDTGRGSLWFNVTLSDVINNFPTSNALATTDNSSAALASRTLPERITLRHFSRKIINLYYVNDFSLHRRKDTVSHETSNRDFPISSTLTLCEKKS